MKAYISIMDGFQDIDTFTAGESGPMADIIGRIERTIAQYNVNMEFSYTLYDSPRGLSIPVYSRRGMVRDIVADMIGEKA